MVNRIEMELPGYKVSINDGICIINNQKIKITKEDVDNIIRTIRTWDNIYKSNSITEEVYNIYLYDNEDNLLDEFLFEGNYPSLFSNLLELIGELYARR